MLRRALLGFTAAMVCMADPCEAQSFDLKYFTPTAVGGGARATAMGGAGVAAVDDGMAAAVNPAALTRLASSQALVVGRFSFGSVSLHPRSPLPNDVSLEGSMGSELAPEFVGVVFPLSTSGRRIMAALAVTNLFDLSRSTLFRWVVGHEYPIKNYRDIDETSTGGLYALTCAIGAELNQRFSAGLTVHFLSGRHRVELSERSAVEGVESGQTTWRQENKFSGLSLQAATTAKVARSLDLGLKLSLPHTLTFVRPSPVHSADDTAGADFGLKIPLFLTVGAAFRPRNRVCLALDYRWAPWSKAKLDTADWVSGPSMPDAHSVHFGIEYQVPFREVLLPVRLGIRSDPRAEYQFAGEAAGHRGKPVRGVALCAGVGVQSVLVSFDLSVDFALSDYAGRNVFSEEPEDWRVKEQTVKVVFAATVKVQ